MHELSIAQNIIEIVISQIVDYPGASVLSITVSAGKFSGVDPEALKFCFPVASDGTSASGADLIIELQPLVIKCKSCKSETETSSLLCPQCRAIDVQEISGRDLYVTSIEMDIPENDSPPPISGEN